MKGDLTKIIDFEDASFVTERCEFKRKQIYEHIDENIQKENAFRAWLTSNDSFNLDYSVFHYVVSSYIDYSSIQRRV